MRDRRLSNVHSCAITVGSPGTTSLVRPSRHLMGADVPRPRPWDERASFRRVRVSLCWREDAACQLRGTAAGSSAGPAVARRTTAIDQDRSRSHAASILRRDAFSSLETA